MYLEQPKGLIVWKRGSTMTTGCAGEKAKLALEKEHTIFSTKLI